MEFIVWPPDIDFSKADSLPDVKERRQEAYAWAHDNGGTTSRHWVTGFYASGKFIAFRFPLKSEVSNFRRWIIMHPIQYWRGKIKINRWIEQQRAAW